MRPRDAKEASMKGDAKLNDTLNSLLSDELTAINQYMVHAEMCENWGYEKLHDHFKKRSIDEMKHAERLIARILFLEGRPVVSELRKMLVGPEVPKMFAGDHELEMGAIKAASEARKMAQRRPPKSRASRPESTTVAAPASAGNNRNAQRDVPMVCCKSQAIQAISGGWSTYPQAGCSPHAR